MQSIPETGFLRIDDIIGNRKKNIRGIIPVCRSTWYDGIKAGKYPAPVKIGKRASAWRAEDIRTLVEKLGS